MTIFPRPSEWARSGTQHSAATPFAGGDHQYFAFLSYSHRDAAMAQWLHDMLEKYRVPKHLVGRITEHGAVPRRLKPIFRDLGELPASTDLGGEIRSALAASQFLVVLCSPASANSRWTNAEIEAFKRAHPDGCVFAVIVGGEPCASDIPGREAEECLPRALRYKYDRRGRPTTKRAEPLAADLREQGEAGRMGFLKLVAGMLGVGLDDLVQREAVRRHRRMATVAGTSVLGMLVASALALTAFQARNEARDQRREAEGLVAFMLGDLKDKLEPIGRLDALDSVGSKVLAYYAKQDTSELSDAALMQRLRALSLTAQVAYLRGDYAGAARLYREAVAGTGEAIRRDRDDPQRLFDHAQNVFWVGELARHRGQIGEAEKAYREYKRLADRMVAIEPDNLKWRLEVGYARENLGIVLMSQRRFAEAAAQFEGALRPIESLASIDPANSTYQKEASNALAWLAQAQWALGRVDSAIALRRRQVAFLDRALASGAKDVVLHQHLIPAHQALGLMFTFRGEVEGGADHYRLALAEANGLLAVEPDNSMWKDLAASVRLDLAKNLIARGSREEAAQETAIGCEAAAALRARGGDVARWRALQTTCLEIQSRQALASGAAAQALTLAERALVAVRAERSGDPIADLYRVAAVYRLLGDARRRIGDHKGATASWSAGLKQLPANVTERPLEMSERAELLGRVGRSGEARPLAERLSAMGYRNLDQA